MQMEKEEQTSKSVLEKRKRTKNTKESEKEWEEQEEDREAEEEWHMETRQGKELDASTLLEGVGGG